MQNAVFTAEILISLSVYLSVCLFIPVDVLNIIKSRKHVKLRSSPWSLQIIQRCFSVMIFKNQQRNWNSTLMRAYSPLWPLFLFLISPRTGFSFLAGILVYVVAWVVLGLSSERALTPSDAKNFTVFSCFSSLTRLALVSVLGPFEYIGVYFCTFVHSYSVHFLVHLSTFPLIQLRGWTDRPKPKTDAQ